MFAIIGLGNPGEKYQYTRHNLGFLTIDHLANKLIDEKVSFKKKPNYLYQNLTHNNQKILLVKPTTFVNLSGEAVVSSCSYFNIPKDKILIIVDDYYLPFGSLRIRGKGSSGGHNGLKSIEEKIGTTYLRLRAGIFNDTEKRHILKFVLDEFNQQEKKSLTEFIPSLGKTALTIATEGIERAHQEHDRLKSSKQK